VLFTVYCFHVDQFKNPWKPVSSVLFYGLPNLLCVFEGLDKDETQPTQHEGEWDNGHPNK